MEKGLFDIRREFLDWNRPALPEAARRLTQRYRQGKTLDLGHVIVVTPGKRAGRRLRELLAFQAEDDGLRFTPPEVVTEGRLPEMLYIPKQPFAKELTQDLAWSRALRDLPLEQRLHLIPQPPEDSEVLRWLALGKMLRRMHAELAADGFDFTAVYQHCAELPNIREARRWQALVAVQTRYLALLDAQELWDIQTARLKAIEFGEITTASDIILLGTVDLNRALRQMLDAVAKHVSAYIVAPEKLASHFDEHGCLIPKVWCEATVPLDMRQYRQVDSPIEQTAEVSDWLAELGNRYSVDQIAIGVADEALVTQLQRQLDQSNVKARWVEGVRLGESAPYRLLAAAVKFADGRRYEDLAALIRHPEVEDWLGLGHGLPARLDEYYNERLPSRIYPGTLPTVKKWADLSVALQHIDAWLKEGSDVHPLREWGAIFRGMLKKVYDKRTLDLSRVDEDTLHSTLMRIVEACDLLDALPADLDTATLSGSDAFQAALGPLAEEYLPPPADADAIEILGWLELPLDDSEALIVTSFNEGFVPQSANADAFLPDSLRREVGILHNERRYARDAYATSVLFQARKELRVVFARRNTKDDPLQPSRLVFACPDDELIARSRAFFRDQPAPAKPRRLLLQPDGKPLEKSRFTWPRPVRPSTPRREARVTEFKDFLACSYRYYLRHVEGLGAVDDGAREMEGSAFGNLLHKALGAFGRNRSLRDSEREKDIFDFLTDYLDTAARQTYGANRYRPALRMQIEQARLRLKAFAPQQVDMVRKGWRIVYAEDDEAQRCLTIPFPVDGEPFTLVGRIDRIDFNELVETVRILDYKSGDRGEHPETVHRKKDKWVDLQLPLYRHLWREAWREAPADCKVQLGFFNLPKNLADTGFVPAEWDEGAFAGADQAARGVIHDLLAGNFKQKPTHPAPKYCDDLSAICLDNVFAPPKLQEESEGDDS